MNEPPPVLDAEWSELPSTPRPAPRNVGGIYLVPFVAWTFDGKGAGKPGDWVERRFRFAAVQGAWRLRRIRLADPDDRRFARALEVRELRCGTDTPIMRVADEGNARALLRVDHLDRIRFRTSVTLGLVCELLLRTIPEHVSAGWTLPLEMIATFDEQPPPRAPRYLGPAFRGRL